MNVLILPHHKAVQYNPAPKCNTVMIRCLEPEDVGVVPKLEYEDKFAEVLELYFHDIRKDLPIYQRYVLFTDSLAEQVRQFFERNRQANMVVIHCHAGESRSSAIAIGLARFLKDTVLEQSIWENEKYCPNELVLKRLTACMNHWQEI